MSEIEMTAWERYCADTAGSMDARDYWDELPPKVQARYVEEVTGDLQAVYA